GHAVGLAQLVQVVLAGGKADHPGGVGAAQRLAGVAEAEDQAGRVGPCLALQVQPLRQRGDRGLQALRGGAVAVQALGHLRDEGDALGIAGLGPGRDVRHRPSIARRPAQQTPAYLYAAAGLWTRPPRIPPAGPRPPAPHRRSAWRATGSSTTPW